MKHSDLCKDCQAKIPLMDYNKAVEVIKAVIKLDTRIWQSPELDVATIHDYIQLIARLAHEAVGSTMNE